MILRLLTAVGASIAVLGATTHVRADDQDQRPGADINAAMEAQNREAEKRGLVSRTSSDRDGAHLFWAVVSVPERLLEAVFLPLATLTVVAERYQVPDRIDHLLSNEAGTIKASPKFKFSTGQGFGVGASLNVESKLASAARFRASGLYEIDGDFEVGIETERRVASLEGRLVHFNASFESQGSSDFYGVGAGTSDDDRRELGIDDLRATLEVDLNSRAAQRVYGTAHVGFLRQKLYPGTGAFPPVSSEEGPAPSGFDETSNYASIGFEARLDSRDTEGRTSEGYLLGLDGRLLLDVADGNRSAVTLKTGGGLFIPLAGRRRTLVLSVGAALAARPIGEDGDIPLDGFVVLGRKAHLAGYNKDRFRVTRAVWTRAEYRYPIWYLRKYPVVMTSRLFVDVGKVGNNFQDLIDDPLRYSVGSGLLLELYQKTLSGAQLAWSPEGIEFVFTVGGSFL